MSEQIEAAAADIPPYRYTAALADEIEDALAGLLGRARHLPRAEPDRAAGRPGPPAGRAPRSCSCWTCSRTRPGPGCTSGTRWATSAPTATAASSGWPGRNVLHAMGFDAFGLPAEQYAVQTGKHPRLTTEANVERYRAQLRRLGLAYDARRSVATTDVEFYRWTQWIFLQIFNSWYDPDAAQGPPDRRAGRASSQQASGPLRTAGRGPSCPRSSVAGSSTTTGWPTSARRR